MGQLIDGKWVTGSVINSDKQGAFDRKPTTFHGLIASDQAIFKPESGRYHLYVSYACPWATRALIYLTLKDLETHLSVSVVHPDMLEQGWCFATNFEGATGDALYGFDYLYQLYQKAHPKVSTRVTVPVLWDKKTQTLVNNESSEIIRIFNTAFNELTGNTQNYYPKALRSEIDAWNDKIYHTINNGVYRSGFAKTQAAYDEAVMSLFNSLDDLDVHLKERKYLVGEQLTEADLRLVPTLLRFDVVYYLHFKTNLRKISDYQNLSRYLRAMYAIPAINKHHRVDHIKRHYYYSHEVINPYRIVPIGPEKYI